ncbi:MAG: TonB-dependent receptor [Cellvibrio sp.]|uniref:TonB-dependent siderophore receptor n=1 Tax=Cellvibrio sp. TaxID=1965322 RepID=UPI0031B54915
MPNCRLFTVSLLACAIATLGAVNASAQNVDAQTANAASSSVQAQHSINLSAGPLSSSLNALARQLGITLAVDPALVNNKQAPAVTGNYSAQQALDLLLANSGLSATAAADGSYSIVVQPKSVGVLRAVKVTAAADRAAVSEAYAGGQVASRSRVGIMGNLDVFETPFSTQSFTESFVRDQQARRVADIINVDPSVRSAQAEYGDTETYIIRGLPLFVNQVGVNGLYGMTEQRRITPEFYERIDVLKGPASMLNGMTPFGVVGGNVNLVTKRALDTPLARLTGSYISDSQLGAHLDVGRRFGSDNAWGARANLLSRSGDTPIDNQDDRMLNGALALDYRGEKLTASIDLTTQERKTNGQTANMVYNPGFALPKALDNTHNFANEWEFIDTNADYLMAQVAYEFSPLATAYLNYGKGQGDEEYFYAASQMRRIINSAGDFTARVGGFRGSYESETYDLGLRGEFHTGSVSHKYAISYTDFERQSYGSTLHATPVYTGNIYVTAQLPEPTLTYGVIPQNGDVQPSSIGVMDTLGFADDKILLTLGVREQKIYAGIFSGGIKTREYDESELTPTGAFLVKHGNYSFYANYSEGLAQGTNAPNGTANQGEMLPPTVTKQQEAGVKYDAGTFGFTGAVFEISLPSTLINSGNVFVADGEQLNRGLELSTFGQPIEGLRLIGGVTLIDAKQTRTQGGINDGKDAVGVPETNIVLNAEYDVSGIAGLTLTSRVNSFSSAQADVGNTQSIPGWETLDLGARYTTTLAGKKLALRANVMNVTDKSYWNSVSRGFLTMGAPRTLLLSASVDF